MSRFARQGVSNNDFWAKCVFAAPVRRTWSPLLQTLREQNPENGSRSSRPVLSLSIDDELKLPRNIVSSVVGQQSEQVPTAGRMRGLDVHSSEQSASTVPCHQSIFIDTQDASAFFTAFILFVFFFFFSVFFLLLFCSGGRLPRLTTLVIR